MSQKIEPLFLGVIEGPAGSGKSTLIRELVRDYPTLFRVGLPPLDIPRPRNYATEDNGAELSLIKDMAHLISVVKTWKSDLATSGVPKVYLIDRFILSGLVYGAMRMGHWTAKDVRMGLKSGLETAQAVATEYCQRSSSESVGLAPVLPELKVHFFHLSITTEELHRRRLQNITANHLQSSHYPFPAETERHIYEVMLSWPMWERCYFTELKSYELPHEVLNHILRSPLFT